MRVGLVLAVLVGRPDVEAPLVASMRRPREPHARMPAEVPARHAARTSPGPASSSGTSAQGDEHDLEGLDGPELRLYREPARGVALALVAVQLRGVEALLVVARTVYFGGSRVRQYPGRRF